MLQSLEKRHFHFDDDVRDLFCLPRVSSNQTMKLTATLMRFGDAFPVATFLSPRRCLSPGDRSLSFSR
jgi:hypothetical protein